MAYSVGILVLSFLSQQRGVQVWRSSVSDAKFAAFSSNIPATNSSGGYYTSVSNNMQDQAYQLNVPSGLSGGYGNGGIGATPGPYPQV